MSLFVPLGMGPDRRESLHQAFCYRAGDETGWIGSQEQYVCLPTCCPGKSGHGVAGGTCSGLG